MDISVCIVAYNAAEPIDACLRSILDLTPHGGRTEVLVVDGGSADDTQKIVRGFAGRVRLVENPKRTIASNRNVALREALYPYIAFTDSDCIVPPDWLAILSESFEAIQKNDASLAGVGGGNIAPSGKSPFQAALGVALDSFLGSLGSVQGRIFDKRRRVASIACLNALYSRAALESAGGFDEQLENMCEDADMNYRLDKKGYGLYFVPGVLVEHGGRRSFLSWCVNMYHYGIGRARIMCKHRTLFSPAHAVALLFFPGLLIASLLGLVWPQALLVWLYIPLIMFFGFFLALNKHPVSGLRVGLILLGTHLFYAAGLWRGFFAGYPGNSGTGQVRP
ncbi:MAG: glycosyltransferase [Candidatus Omnitrophota bacterium]